jgi:tRNA A-37 threonylcarbamoyl transferase component Bud32
MRVGDAGWEAWVRSRVRELLKRDLDGRPVVFADTSSFMAIDRDHVIDLEGELFLVRGSERETRFGLGDQPKFWVKRVLGLESGRTQILKLVFPEEFRVRVGALEVRCARSAEKEAEVLRLVRGDGRFMQGRAVRDAAGNLVRVLDVIDGTTLLEHLLARPLSHEQYFETVLPSVLAQVVDCLRGIHTLHAAGLVHGDIRNDHILVERDGSLFRWIDFDLRQDSSAFDVWSVGNVLHFVVGRGFVHFRDIVHERPELSGRLVDDDASVFFPFRLMNLGKVFPYLPRRLNEVLLRFSVGARTRYESVGAVVDDLCECARAEGWPTAGAEADAPAPASGRRG